MTTAKINIKDIKVSYLTKLNLKGQNAEVCVSRRPKLNTLPKGSDKYVANLFLDGNLVAFIGTMPNLVDASVVVKSITK